MGIPRNRAPLPKPWVIAPSRWIGYGDSGPSPPTIIGLVSREIGAIAALGGGGDLGMSVDDAEGGGDVVILRSVLDIFNCILSRLKR